MVAEKLRTFIAIDFPEEVIKEVARVQNILKNTKFTGKLTELENLHLTLKFLGEIDSEKLEIIRKELKNLEFSSLDLNLGSIGLFSINKSPRIVWIKIQGKSIFNLQKSIDEILSNHDFKKEARFMSHLTIARIKNVKNKTEFTNYIKNTTIKNINFKVSSFKLKISKLNPLGPIYNDLEIYSSK